MSPENFVYWLNGFVELDGGSLPTGQQWESIKDHLKLVMDKKTPVRNVKVEPNSLKEHMESVSDLFKENPVWQQDLLKSKFTC